VRTPPLSLTAARIDLERQQVERDGAVRSLTSMEVALLRYLAARPGETVSRDTLLAEVWSYKPGTVTRAVDFTVHRLRRKIEADPSEPDHLITVHGEGYRLALPAGVAGAAGNLPPEGNRFVGRSDVLAYLQRALHDGSRLLTLHGPGGAGKTRLALRLAGLSGEAFPGGVWLVELASARSAAAVVYAIAAALSVPLTATTLDAQRGEVSQHLRSRGATLLILDNFEQVVDHGAPIVAKVLADAPGVSAVVTSRQRLGLPGERPVSVEALEASAGVELFADRAASVCPGFELSPTDRRVVADIVARLDGSPLAIELAAGRAAVLSPAEIRDRLPRRFALLRGPRGGLSSVIEGSWALLSGWEREALAQLSVFRGGFTMVAAEAVLSLPDDGPAAVDAVQALLDKSLVLRRPRQGRAPQRFSLGESIRLFASARLAESGDKAAARARHRAWYLGRWPSRPVGAASAAERAALAAELDNLIAIWRRALPESPAAAVAALQALRPLFLARGPSRALLELLDQAIDAAPDPALQAEAHFARGGVRLVLGQLQGALDDMDAALARLSDESPPALRGAILTERALALDRLGREAEPVYQEARAVFATAGDRAGMARVDGYMGSCRFGQGDTEGARTLMLRALASARATGQLAFAGAMEANLGSVEFKRERLEDAERHYRRGLAVFQAEGDTRREGMARILLGLACVLQGRLDEAEAHLEEGVALQERIGAQRGYGIALGWLGMMHHLRGDHAEAEEVYAASAEALSASGDTHHQTFVCATRSILCASTGALAAAAEHLAHAELIGADSPLPAHARGIALARLFLDAARLGDGDRSGRDGVASALDALPPVAELQPFWGVLRQRLAQ